MKPVIYSYSINIAEIACSFVFSNCDFKLSLISKISSGVKARGSYIFPRHNILPLALPPTHSVCSMRLKSVTFNPLKFIFFALLHCEVIIIIIIIINANASWCVSGEVFPFSSLCLCVRATKWTGWGNGSGAEVRESRRVRRGRC